MASAGAANAQSLNVNAGDTHTTTISNDYYPDGAVINGVVNVVGDGLIIGKDAMGNMTANGLNGGGTPGPASSGVINLTTRGSSLDLSTTKTTVPYHNYTGRVTGIGAIRKGGDGRQELNGFLDLTGDLSVDAGTLLVSGLGSGTSLDADRIYNGQMISIGDGAQLIFRLPSANRTQAFNPSQYFFNSNFGGEAILSSERGTLILNGQQYMNNITLLATNGGVIQVSDMRSSTLINSDAPGAARAVSNGTIRVASGGPVQVSTVYAASGGVVQVSGVLNVITASSGNNVEVANGGILMGGVGTSGSGVGLIDLTSAPASNVVVQNGGVIYANGGTTPATIQQGGRLEIRLASAANTVTLAAGAKYVVNIWGDGNWVVGDAIPGVGLLNNDLLVINGGQLVLDPAALIEVNLVGSVAAILKDYPIIQLENGASVSGLPTKVFSKDGRVSYDVNTTLSPSGRIVYLTPSSTSIVPEPSTYALWGGLGLLGLGVLRKLRQRRRRVAEVPSV